MPVIADGDTGVSGEACCRRFYVNERQVVSRDLDSGSAADKQHASCRRAANAMVSGIRALEVNPYSQGAINILVTSAGRKPDSCPSVEGHRKLTPPRPLKFTHAPPKISRLSPPSFTTSKITPPHPTKSPDAS